MAEGAPWLPRRWAMRTVYLGLGLGLIFVHLMPLQTVPRGWAGPDVMVALTLAWVLRRPDHVPPLLVAAVFFLGDLLFQRPPGLWAAIMVMAAQALRHRAPGLREQSFAAEVLAVAGVLVTATLAYRIVLALFVVDRAPLGLSLMQMLATLAVYPLVVAGLHLILGVRRAGRSDPDRAGGRP